MLPLTDDQKRRLIEELAHCRTDKARFAKIFFGVDLSPKQIDALTIGGQVSTKIAGRRFGKSMVTLIDVVHGLVTRRNAQGMVAAPSIDQAALYWEEFESAVGRSAILGKLVKDGPEKGVKRSPFPEIRFVNGSKLVARSTAQGGKFVRGKGVDLLAVTEAAFVPDEVYEKVLRATTLDRKGRTLLESTPNGMNYVHDRYQRGLHDEDGYYKAFHATCYDNPRLDPEEIRRIREETPDLAFRVEFLAEFVEDDTFVFPWATLQRCYDEDYTPGERAEDGHRYIIGLDLAKLSDYTVAFALDRQEPLRIVEWYRTRGTLYSDVVGVVNRLQAKYKADVWYDETGVGEAVGEGLNKAHGFTFNQRTRQDLISRLVVTVEQAKIHLPPALTVLRDELRFFQNIRHGASVKAEAAQGHHDDAVMALALAVWGATQNQSPLRIPTLTASPSTWQGVR
ncbi:MAG: terminase family protein [Patescibacteria group bacterium]|nr:terminase family protein [Patescibacteria group bacterium]